MLMFFIWKARLARAGEFKCPVHGIKQKYAEGFLFKVLNMSKGGVKNSIARVGFMRPSNRLILCDALSESVH